jgi:hypothetical protein
MINETKESQLYWLVAGEIVFYAKDSDVPNAVRVNTVVTSQDERVTVAQIGRVQQALQMNFFKRMNDAELKVVDVVILAWMPMGRQTSEEFNAVPAGSQLVEAMGNA